MKRIFSLCMLSFALLACSKTDDGAGEHFTPQTFDVYGKVEKGPFVSGSTISIQPMNAKLQVLGGMYNALLSNDMGGFEFGSKEFASPYAELMATGYFFNEVKGSLSNGTLTLRALVDLTDQSTANVNILTHLKYARVKRLVASGMQFAAANSQAQQELFASFGLSKFADREVASFSMMTGSDEAAALIAISSLLLMDRSEAAFTEYLARLSDSFGQQGCFSDSQIAQIADDKRFLAKELDAIEQHLIARYDELGVAISVKELAPFIDWDSDGVAGNELLREGDEIRLNQSSIEVPVQGGTYAIQVESPIPLYLESQVESDLTPNHGVTNEEFFSEGLYEGYDDVHLNQGVDYSATLQSGELSISVAASKSYRTVETIVPLYDFIGNQVASVTLIQQGQSIENMGGQVPKLGEHAVQVVASVAGFLAEAISAYNLIEQYYAYNNTLGLVKTYVGSGNSAINEAWTQFYKANSNLLLLQQADAERLNLYGDYCAVLQALYYSTMVYGWGGVPYITKYEQYDEMMAQGGWPREQPERIFADLKSKLLTAIENLEEKRNDSLSHANGFFFVSKDVARVLLANICMYEGDYDEARPLLEKVVSNNYYSLDASTNFRPSIDMSGVDVTESTEVIFALRVNTNPRGTRGRGITLVWPGVMPYITLSDVLLSLAECCYKAHEGEKAEEYLEQILQAKRIELTESDTLAQIRELREQLLIHSGTYFAFLKRTQLAKTYCNIEPYQLLFPIPDNERTNRFFEQNPGW